MQRNFRTGGRRRTRLFAVFLALTGIPPGCEGGVAPLAIAATCRSVGLCEAPRPTPFVVEVVLDTSLGSPCTAETARASITRALQAVADRPASMARVWAQGTQLSDTTPVATVEYTLPARSGTRVLRAHRERFLRESEATITAAITPLFQVPRKRRSPILETLARIAITASPNGMPRTILLVSDAREVSSFGDFECDLVPTTRRFLPMLRRRQVLPPGSLTGTRVVWSFVNLAPVEGRVCPVTIARATAIENLWRTVLTEAGASSVRFERGLVPLDALAPAIVNTTIVIANNTNRTAGSR